MDQKMLETALSGLPLGGLRYFDRIDSTNTEASRWLQAGVPDLALVVADEQTAGQGRLKRRWFTPPGAALAFTLVLRPEAFPGPAIFRATALGALAVSQALEEDYALPAQIKWPNDVLVERRKLCGVLAESHWQGERLQAVILGIGINVAPSSVPPTEDLNYPATCVEMCLDPTGAAKADRIALLRSVLANLLEWRPKLASPDFLQAWESRLAFQGEWVQVLQDVREPAANRSGPPPAPSREGRLLGLAQDGSLRLQARSGEEFTVQVGEIHLRPVV